MLPDRFLPPATGLSAKDERRAIEATNRAELQGYLEALQIRLASQREQLMASALSDATRSALREEFAALDEGLRLAGGDPVRISMAVSRVDLLKSGNDRRLRRFGA